MKLQSIWFEILDAWDESRALRWTAIGLLVGLLVAVAGYARAVEPGWYAPADNGEGIIVRCNAADNCAMLWATHGDGEQIWLISVENCPREDRRCEVPMADTSGSWRGRTGGTEIADPSVVLTATQNEDGISVEWDARALFPDRCFDVGSGGLLLAECIGRAQFDLLAR